MRGARLCYWMLATGLCIIFNAGALLAHVSMRTVLIVDSESYSGVEQVRAELLALGYQVIRLKVHASPAQSESLAAIAQENLASFAIEFVVVDENLQLWLYDASVGTAPSLQQFSIDALQGEMERMEVLHVVEYLRAALIQSESRAKLAALPVSPGVVVSTESKVLTLQPQNQSAPVAAANATSVAPRAREIEQVSPATSTSTARPPFLTPTSTIPGHVASLGIALAPGVALMNKLRVPVPAISAGVTWYVRAQWAVTVQGLLPLTTRELSRSLGTSDVTAVGLSGLLRYRMRKQGSPWQPHWGGGMTVFWVEKRYSVLAPVPSLEMGLHWQPRETWSLYASLLAGLPIWVSPDVRKKWGELWEMSSPAIFFASVGVEWRAAAWGKRD